MAYRPDRDLEFLGYLKSEDLNDLVYCLTHDRDGSPRLTEELTMADAWKEHHPDHHAYWRLIAAEIQCFGANTFATMLRGGEGVLYKEVLVDACGKMKVNFNKDSSVERIESSLLMKILTDALERMSPEELRELAEEIGVENASGITPEAVVGAFQAIFRAGGFKSYQLTLIVVNAVLKALIGRGLTIGGNVLLVKTMAILTGPIGWVVTGLWTAIDIAGTAYRVTIPAVIQVAALRQKHLYEAQDVSSGSAPRHTEFEAELYMLSKQEGGRHTPFFKRYQPQFCFRATGIIGEVKLPEDVDMGLPGKSVKVNVTLTSPVAMDEGLRFEIREGGRTVGNGVVLKIIA